MKKRSKLDLSPDVKQRKAQAGSFDTKPASKPEVKAESGSADEARAKPRVKPQIKSKGNGQHTRAGRQQSASTALASGFRPSRMLVMTATVVAAAAVIAFYVLRRR